MTDRFLPSLRTLPALVAAALTLCACNHGSPAMKPNTLLSAEPAPEVRGDAAEIFRSHQEGKIPGEDVGRVMLHARPDWLGGPVELRFPEVLNSSSGMYFMDNYMPHIPVLLDVATPIRWTLDESTGTWSYTHTFPDGFAFGATARPAPGSVELGLWVRNGTDQPMEWVTANPCLDLGTAPEFDAPWDTERLYAYFNGGMNKLSATTPTSKDMGREPWLLFLTPRGVQEFKGPKVTPTWWLVDQPMEKNLMAAVTADGRHLLGYAWNEEDRHCMSNCGNPCLHTGPGPALGLMPGETHRWFGRIYFMENDMEKLVKVYEEDVRLWVAMTGRE